MKLANCAKLHLKPLTGNRYRAISIRHWKTRLSTLHSKSTPGRFSSASPTNPLYKILYLAENHQAALLEVEALLGLSEALLPNPRGNWTIISLDIQLRSVADLTLPSQAKLIGTNAQESTGVLRHHHTGPTPTQLLGKALFDVNEIEAFLVPSAKSPSPNLIVFPEKLRSGSRVAFHNEATGRVEFLFP